MAFTIAGFSIPAYCFVITENWSVAPLVCTAWTASPSTDHVYVSWIGFPSAEYERALTVIDRRSELVTRWDVSDPAASEIYDTLVSFTDADSVTVTLNDVVSPESDVAVTLAFPEEIPHTVHSSPFPVTDATDMSLTVHVMLPASAPRGMTFSFITAVFPFWIETESACGLICLAAVSPCTAPPPTSIWSLVEA